MILLAITVLVLLLALREVTTNRIHRTRDNPTAVRRWRAARRWLNLALVISALALLPTFIDQPQLPVIAEAHTLLSYAWPLILGAAAVAAAVAARTALPELHRERERRAAVARRNSDAAKGLNPSRISDELRQWIDQNAPAHRYRFDVETSAGIANIVVETEEARYALYVLPPEHASLGFTPALQRCARVAGVLNARGVLWVPGDGPEEPQRSRDHPVYVIYGSMTRIFDLIERNETALRRRRERQARLKDYAAASAERANEEEEAQRQRHSRAR
ncbi:hypothetical protein [Halorhodospira halophila]|uniref:Uncharacterized protein n=1 Tax=Halorhodospira halophila (strain DSM 244 / SL1) TaxID=349124 RepID=A1WUM9_HALHL|nr:hypothetical protein [Halorhodospira halophila]ABM61391.1 hypothetical protein Hhal_0605 [Halorhodospira halophila SL1]MBK1729026.1 hypothetical protein [Halorhodospira halophila]